MELIIKGIMGLYDLFLDLIYRAVFECKMALLYTAGSILIICKYYPECGTLKYVPAIIYLIILLLSRIRYSMGVGKEVLVVPGLIFFTGMYFEVGMDIWLVSLMWVIAIFMFEALFVITHKKAYRTFVVGKIFHRSIISQNCSDKYNSGECPKEIFWEDFLNQIKSLPKGTYYFRTHMAVINEINKLAAESKRIKVQNIVPAGISTLAIEKHEITDYCDKCKNCPMIGTCTSLPSLNWKPEGYPSIFPFIPMDRPSKMYGVKIVID